MKNKIKLYIILYIILFAVLFTPLLTMAAIDLKEDRMKYSLDLANFPDEEKKMYMTFSEKCGHHHSLYRPIVAIKTGRAPVTESKFGKNEVKNYVVKMMRKPNSGIDREDAKLLIKFIYYLIDNKDKVKEIAEANDHDIHSGHH